MEGSYHGSNTVAGALIRTPNVLLTAGIGATTILPPTATPLTTVTLLTTPVPQDPSGFYTGTWTSLLSANTGSMTLNVINVDPFTFAITTATAGLFLNGLIPVAINVSGVYTFPTFVLTGTYLDPASLITYTLELTCTYSGTLTLPRIIQGTYLIHDPLYIRTDRGIFYVETYGFLI